MTPVAYRVGKQVFFAGRHACDAADELIAELIVAALNHAPAHRAEEDR